MYAYMFCVYTSVYVTFSHHISKEFISIHNSYVHHSRNTAKCTLGMGDTSTKISIPIFYVLDSYLARH